MKKFPAIRQWASSDRLKPGLQTQQPSTQLNSYSPPRRGEAYWPRWDEALIGEGPAVLESFSLSPGLRTSVFRN